MSVRTVLLFSLLLTAVLAQASEPVAPPPGGEVAAQPDPRRTFAWEPWNDDARAGDYVVWSSPRAKEYSERWTVTAREKGLVLVETRYFKGQKEEGKPLQRWYSKEKPQIAFPRSDYKNTGTQAVVIAGKEYTCDVLDGTEGGGSCGPQKCRKLVHKDIPFGGIASIETVSNGEPKQTREVIEFGRGKEEQTPGAGQTSAQKADSIPQEKDAKK